MILNGSRVLVYDNVDFKNDVDTPYSMLMRPAIVVCRYGIRSKYSDGVWEYPDLVDVIFDHKPQVSHGHFTDGVKEIN